MRRRIMSRDGFANVIADMRQQEYPDWRTYEALYQRYQERPVGDLVDVAGDVRGKRVLDLCGGSGRLAEECVGRGAADVLLVDESRRMTGRLRRKRGIRLFPGRVQEMLAVAAPLYRDAPRLGPDFVFCRQAVNYWIDTAAAKALAGLMPAASVFVFNTFNTKPKEEPHATSYFVGQDLCTEIGYRVGDVVHHVQCREGYRPHVTSFLWISPKEFREMLSPCFEAEEVRHGRTSIWRCVRRATDEVVRSKGVVGP